MKFCDIVGHEVAKKVLSSMVETQKIPHAILIHGPAGIGKFRLARAFAQYINCKNPKNGDSCGVCPSCVQTSKLNNPDIHYIYPIVKKSSNTEQSEDYFETWRTMLSNNSYMPYEKWLDLLNAGSSQPVISVGDSTEILRKSSLSSYSGKYKIFILWLPEKMTAEAANKLLKVIEEPHEDTIFILVSNNPRGILPTIKSRLRSLETCPLHKSDIEEWLRAQGFEKEDMSAIAAIAKGNMNIASELASNKSEFQEFAALFMDMMRSCYANNIKQMRSLAEDIVSFGREKELRLLGYFGRMVRENYIFNLNIPSIIAMTSQEKIFASKFSPFINSNNIIEIENQIDKAYTDIGRNANQKIVWFDFMLYMMRLLRLK